MPHIDSTKFGEITIDGKKYHQVLIIGNLVVERDYKKLEELFGTSHQIGEWEVEDLLKENPEIIIVGTGQDGAMEVDRDFSEKVKNENIGLITAITPEALKIYNEKISAGKRVNALIHTTC
jgi:hypothetical protein